VKAEILAAARRHVRAVEVPSLVHFSVREWRRRPRAVLRRIAATVAGAVAVRSSARDEDGAAASRAGHYTSVLGVANEPGALATAIERVAAPLAADPENRVLVQAMARDVVASGVVTTRDAATGAPYYVVEYDRSGRTDTVTGGLVVPTTAVVFRGAAARAIRDPLLRRLVCATREVERWRRRTSLEIEFAAARDGRVALLQVRPLATAPGVGAASTGAVAARLRRLADAIADVDGHHGAAALAGGRTILAQMSDWNPAELIGAHPSPLAASLFAALVTDDVWQRARVRMGYRAVPGVPLMRLVAGRPYVDVRASFNSFVPAGMPTRIATALVDGWLARLHAHPELHDKVELEVAETAVDFASAQRTGARGDIALSRRDAALWTAALRALTNRALASGPASSLRRALDRADALGSATRTAASEPLPRAFALLDACRRRGTMAFAVIARHAFIAETLLRSAVARDAWTAARLAAFRRSLTSVASELPRDLRRAARDPARRAQFLRRYGHVRPSSFDVGSLRYDQRRDLFRDVDARAIAARPREQFVLTGGERRACAALAREAGLAVDPDALLRYAATAIVGREHVKLALTRLLSDALECIVGWARGRGIDRSDVAWLTLAELRRAGWVERGSSGRTTAAARRAAVASPACAPWHAIIEERRTARAAERALRLPPLIRDVADLYVPPALPALPTFVTARAVTAPPVVLDGAASGVRIGGRIVCIESADPGFDWIFAHPIAGLATCFGGGNSHMAVRCLEADVPAVIGLGAELFTRVRRAVLVELRCAERTVRAS